MDKEAIAALRQIMREEIQGALGSVNGQLGRMSSRLDSMDSQLNGMDLRLDSMDSRLNGMDLRLDSMDSRLNGIDLRLDNMDSQLIKIEQTQTDQAEFERGTRVLVEGLTKNIQLLAEGQSSSAAKLQQLDRIEVTLNNVKSDTEVIKDIVGWHSTDIQKLKQA